MITGIGTPAIPETVADRALMIEMRKMLPSQEILEFESDEVEKYHLPIKEKLQNFASGIRRGPCNKYRH